MAGGRQDSREEDPDTWRQEPINKGGNWPRDWKRGNTKRYTEIKETHWERNIEGVGIKSNTHTCTQLRR